MKNSQVIRAILLIAYCVPYAFLSVNGDATSGTMLFYGVMVISFTFLCWCALKTKNVAIVFIGNALSFASSYAFGQFSGLDPMGYYFKPFTSHSLIVAVSIISIVVQTIIVLCHHKKAHSTPIK